MTLPSSRQRTRSGERWPSFLGGLAAFCLVVFPPAGFLALTLRFFLVRPRADLRPWLVVWVALLLPFCIRLFAGSIETWLLLQFGIVMGFAYLSAALAKRPVFFGFLLGLLVVALIGGIERERSRQLWIDSASPQTLSDRLKGVTVLSGDSDGWRRNGLRLFQKSWALEPGIEELELTFQARSVDGATGWQWYETSPATVQELIQQGDERFVRVENPVDDPASIIRRVNTGGSVAGRTFRARLDLRAPAPSRGSGCNGLQLRTFEPSFQACESIGLSEHWQRYTIETAFPTSSRQPVFELVIGEMDALQFDVRDVTIEEFLGDSWVPIAPIEPAGITLRMSLPEVHQFSEPTQGFVPTEEWRAYSMSLTHPAIAHLSRADLLLQLESGNVVSLRDIELASLTPGIADPRPYSFPRFELWYPHPNLAGQSFASSGIVMTSLAGGIAAIGVGAVTTILSIVPTGSRAAWFAALFGLLWLPLVLLKGRWRLALLIVMAAALIALVAVAGPSNLGRLAVWSSDSGNRTDRLEIFRVALAAFQQHPLLGIGDAPQDFMNFWRDNYSGSSLEVITHAHNLWLQFAAAYGLSGLIAIVWLTGGLVYTAWRAAGLTGLALVVPILVMNSVDYTLFYAGVLLPLVVGLNCHRSAKRTSSA